MNIIKTMVLIDSKRIFFWPAAILIVALTGIIIYQQYQKISEKNQITIYTAAGSVKIAVEYAETPEKQANGLMNRKSLGKNSGMLFIFPNEEIQSFWMKNMLIPLDIMFISTSGRINEITTMRPCLPDTNDCPTYTSKDPVRFAIEANAGFTTKNRIVEGNILEISGF